MTPTCNATRPGRLRLTALAFALTIATSASLAAGSISGPDFSKSFAPNPIGPGSTSMLTFTIDNTASGTPYDMVAFTDTLPTGQTLAAPAVVENGCGGTLSAPDGGTTISLTDGVIGAGQVCTIVVNVTATTTATNTSGALTSSAGTGGSAIDTLTVSFGLPGFSKSFSPASVPLGGRSTLTFTIDNQNEVGAENLDFTDNLPPGMVVASPSNKATDCGTATFPTTLTAIPGTSTIILDANGTSAYPALAAVATCTVMVDVIGAAVGPLGNVSGNLVVSEFLSQLEAGKAAAVLEVTGFESLLTLEKEFVDDPAAPGGTTTLEFTVTNRSRDEVATDITFEDDLDATLSGLTATVPGTPDPPCGAGSMLSFGMGVLTLTGGTLAPQDSCTFSVTLTVPDAATPGTYPNTTGPVSGTILGDTATGNSASDTLFVVAFPILTKEFTDDPVGAGGTATLQFTIFNSSTASMATDIAFVDELTDNTGGLGGSLGNGFLPFPVSVGLPPVPNPPCGGSSSVGLVFPGIDREGIELTGGSLAASDGIPGGADTCTFTVTVDIPDGFPSGTYTNTTEEITATVAAATVTGPPASDDIVIVGAPGITKEFTDDPVAPGGMVTLVFTLENLDPDNAASAIAFSDNLGAALPGLTVTSVMSDTCGGTPSGVGTTMFGYTGGTLAADDGSPGGPDECAIVLKLTAPGSPPGGTFTNTTSDLTATVAGVGATSPGASDDLVIAGLQFSKAFTDDPVIAGGTAKLVFTFTNLGTSMADDASGIFFTDDLSAILPGTPDVTKIGGPTVNTCGGTDSGTATFVLYIGGSVGFGATCTIEYDLMVPSGIDDDDYPNTTSSLVATIGGTGVLLPPAKDRLRVRSNLLALSKEFTDDPAVPGGTVTLKFTLENLSATETITDIEFTDDLTAALAGLSATGATMNTCGGMATSGFPTGMFGYAGGMLAPGATCMIVLSVDVPPAPLPGSLFPNTTSGVIGRTAICPIAPMFGPGSSTAGPPPACVFGDPASDTLVVRLLTLTKSFDGPTTATGTAVLTFTITNLDDSGGVSPLSFSDDLGAVISGLTATLPPTPNPPCGAGSSLSGTGFLTLNNASLAAAGSPGDSCTFSVTVNVPASATGGSFLNQTSALSNFGLEVAGKATAFLEVEPPPTFAKAFAPNPAGETFDTTLIFTIDNSASSLAASDLSFLDTLPFDLLVAAVPGVTNTCGGSVVATAGTTTVSLAGGSVAAGATCTISVRVNPPTPGPAFVNVTDDLTSTSGNSGTATDTLVVNPCLAANGLDLTLASDVVLGTEMFSVCRTIEVRQHYLVLGPSGNLILEAGVSVLFFDGVEFGDGSMLSVTIDPSLIP